MAYFVALKVPLVPTKNAVNAQPSEPTCIFFTLLGLLTNLFSVYYKFQVQLELPLCLHSTYLLTVQYTALCTAFSTGVSLQMFIQILSEFHLGYSRIVHLMKCLTVIADSGPPLHVFFIHAPLYLYCFLNLSILQRHPPFTKSLETGCSIFLWKHIH